MPFRSKPLEDLIGIGIIFPITINANGSVELYSGWPLISSAIRTLLAFHIGTRFFQGEYGSRMDDLLEEPSDQIIKDLIETFTRDALEKFEKRVVVNNINAVQDLNHPERWEVKLHLRIANTHQEEIMVWPFYTRINT